MLLAMRVYEIPIINHEYILYQHIQNITMTFNYRFNVYCPMKWVEWVNNTNCEQRRTRMCASQVDRGVSALQFGHIFNQKYALTLGDDTNNTTRLACAHKHMSERAQQKYTQTISSECVGIVLFAKWSKSVVLDCASMSSLRMCVLCLPYWSIEHTAPHITVSNIIFYSVFICSLLVSLVCPSLCIRIFFFSKRLIRAIAQ